MSRRRSRDTIPPEAKPSAHTARAVAPATHSLSGRRGLWRWWLVSALLLLGNNSRWLVESERVIAPPTDAVLAPEGAWSAPLSQWMDDAAITEWPYWLFAIVAGGVIGVVGRSVEQRHSIGMALPAVVGLSLGMTGNHLLPAVLLMGSQRSIDQLAAGRPLRTVVILLAMWLGLGIFASLEFGLLLLCAAMSLVAQGGSRLTWRRGAVILGIVAACGLAGVLFPGWGAAALRPVSAWWLLPERWLPSTAFAFGDPATWTWAWLPALCLLEGGRLAVMFPDVRRRRGPLWLLLAVIGLGSARYLWLSTLVMLWTLPPRPAGDTFGMRASHRLGRFAIVAGLLLAFGRLAGMFPLYADYFVTGNLPANRVDPTLWGLRGPVLLMNLEHSRDWQSLSTRANYRLLVDDRWDVFGEMYPDYAAVCRDLEEIRHESYWRTDGRWGGYLRWMKAWQPTLLVADTGHVDAVRRLSLNPQWRLLGLDSRRTIFGTADDPRTFPRSQHALRELFRMEWPQQVGSTPDPGVLIASTDDERRRVGAALLAIRLPYAALRTLPQDGSWDTERLRAWCYVELAHRVRRYTGEISLVDQWRAVTRLQQARRESRWTASELLRIAHSLEGLEQWATAATFAGDVIDGPASRSATGTERHLAEQVIQRQQARSHAAQGVSPEESAEQQIRRAFAEGNSTTLAAKLPSLPADLRDYYALLASLTERPSWEVAERLHQLLQSPSFPGDLRSEGFFFLGCLALEQGDGPSAAAAFSESDRVDPSSSWQPLRLFFRQMLSGQ